MTTKATESDMVTAVLHVGPLARISCGGRAALVPARLIQHSDDAAFARDGEVRIRR